MSTTKDLDRIKKLLALSESANKHEAELAAAAAFGGTLYANGDRYITPDGELKKRVRLQFIGREKDVGAVQYLYQYFCTEINRLTNGKWAEPHTAVLAELQNIGARSWKDSFRKGCATEIYERILRQRASTKNESGSTALVKVDAYEKEAQDYLDNTGAKTARVDAASAAAFQQGKRAGRGINVDGASGSLAAPKKQIGGDR